jgi:aldose 1-epimerase
MFKIKQYRCEKTNQNDIELYNSETSTFAKIQLNQGARLKELVLSDYIVIKEMEGLEYTKTYASSILFPFANRIKDGRYEFENKFYQFPINEKELNNALHGLVYNKEFKVLHTDATEDLASVDLCYTENNHMAGFPYTYTIKLNYTLTQKSLNLAVEIINTDSKTFPFTLGWHPYFFSSDRYNSSVIFDSNKKLKLDDQCITEGVEVSENFGLVEIKNQSLDDCYVLKTNTITFKTPKYTLTLDSSEKESFLQLYTPPNPNMIAIEPTTGVSDSFNNRIGLKTLKPNETYDIEWFLTLENN